MAEGLEFELHFADVPRADKTPFQVLREHHGPVNVGGTVSLGVGLLFGFFGFKDGWQLPWVLVAGLGVALLLVSGVAWWVYGGLVHACGLLRADAVAVKSRGSDDLGRENDVSIFFKYCEIAEQAKVVVNIVDDTDFRVLGGGVLIGRQGDLSRVLVESPAPGSEKFLKRLKENNSDQLKQLRVAVDHGYVDPGKGKVQGPHRDESPDSAADDDSKVDDV